MANQEALIAEYNALMQEISGARQLQMQFIGGALAVAAAFVVYGFQAQYSLAFLAALFINLVAMFFSSDCTKHIVSVRAYLYAIVEPNVEGLQWETMLLERRKRELRFSYSKLPYSISVCIAVLLSIGCVFFTWLFLKNYSILNVILYSSITVMFVVSFILLTIYDLHVSSFKYRLASISQWKQIEKELSPTVTAIHMNS